MFTTAATENVTKDADLSHPPNASLRAEQEEALLADLFAKGGWKVRSPAKRKEAPTRFLPQRDLKSS